MTAKDFDVLPLMISRQKVIEITGWSKATFEKQVKCGSLKPVMTLQDGKRFFRKLDFKVLV